MVWLFKNCLRLAERVTKWVDEVGRKEDSRCSQAGRSGGNFLVYLLILRFFDAPTWPGGLHRTVCLLDTSSRTSSTNWAFVD